MNHKNAMPANGTRFNPRATVFELVLSHTPGFQRIRADRKPEEYKSGNQENRKEDAGDGGGTWHL
jgi:hypothetical protein